MATDKTEPKVKLIAGVAVLSIVFLVGVRFGLVSYFHMETDQEKYTKFGSMPHEERDKLREAEKQALANGPLPIDKAMQQLANQGRGDMQPKPSKDMAALEGWRLMPRAVDSAAPPPAHETPAATDGGTLLDAGADAAPAATDAGVPADAGPATTDAGPKHDAPIPAPTHH